MKRKVLTAIFISVVLIVFGCSGTVDTAEDATTAAETAEEETDEDSADTETVLSSETDGTEETGSAGDGNVLVGVFPLPSRDSLWFDIHEMGVAIGKEEMCIRDRW